MGCCGNKTENANGIELGETSQTDGGKYGKSKKFDPEFNGPIKNRSCTDIPCCILFLVFIIGMVIVGVLAFMWGNPERLIHPVNSEGKMCGTGDYKDKPKLLFFDLTECVPGKFTEAAGYAGLDYVCPTTMVCVEECPTKNEFGDKVNCSKMACIPGIDACAGDPKKLVDEGKCAPYYLQSEDILHRCIPTVFGGTVKEILEDEGEQPLTNFENKNVTIDDLKEGSKVVRALINVQNVGARVLEDVGNSWWILLAGFGIAMVACFLYIVVMRWIAGLMVWLTAYAVLTLLGYGAYYCYTQYKDLDDQGSSSEFKFTTGLSVYKDSKSTWLALTIILGVVLLVLILLLLALRERIQIAVALIKEGSRAISSMMFTLLWPIIPWLLQLILFAWFVTVAVYLATVGDPEFQFKNSTAVNKLCKYQHYVDKKNGTCFFVKFSDEVSIFRLQIYHLFGWFWLLNFIMALGQCVLAGSFASYYWAWDKKTDIPTFPVTSSFIRTLRYHMGSLAFGSLIIAIVQMIRVALEYIEHKLKESGQNNQIVKYILKCLKCCFWCLEKFLKFLNKNAYIEIAIYGKNFCVSAKNAFSLLMRNVVRVVVLDKVTDFLLFIGKLTITLGMAVGSFFWFKGDSNLNYYLAPVIIITVATYVIATAFFSVYEMAIDTLFLCFLEDLERNDGSEEKPYYMSKRLKKILDKKNKKNKKNSDSE